MISVRLTGTAVELVGLRDVAAAELDALSDLRSDGGARVAARRDRVEVGRARERVARVVHDAVEVVRLAERVHLGRRQRVEVVLLPCTRPPRQQPTTVTEGCATLFHRRTRASYVYNGCLAWYNVVLTHRSTQV